MGLPNARGSAEVKRPKKKVNLVLSLEQCEVVS